MRSESFTAILSDKGHGVICVSRHQHSKGQYSCSENYAPLLVGLEAALPIKNCCHKNQTINSIKYSRQLDNLKQVIDQRCSELVIHEGMKGITLDHMHLLIRWKLLDFDWNVLSLPPYSPDLAPFDHHLFRSLQDSLKGKDFNSLDRIFKQHLKQFFTYQPGTFYESGIMKHRKRERWKTILK
ncbi:hypothetical protein AVEN_100875-1 [Araneus ventricosus]|uniref:Tc1-like transposase DDE domain-containing protein n=1 Tax=Araneus ventricosus TaxID=182803 RepID=A0A4Y2AVB8_ARAVE|nr:hypothetical protein AVEN_100875-1 [Araneus ventricosus]